MCYDISFTVNLSTLADYFPNLEFDEGLEMDADVSIHINGHAFGAHPIVYRNRTDQQIHAHMMEWGCIPYYIKDEMQFVKQRASMLNARSERILNDPSSYWFKIRERRCLIPVSGIYEHREIRGWRKKVPYYIKMKGAPLFFLPGLYSVTELPDLETGELIKRFSFTMVTRAANSLMQQIHNSGEHAGRMPLFLPVEMAREWLGDLNEERYRKLLGYEIENAALEYHTVYTIRGTKPHPQEQQKNEPYTWARLPELNIL
ncbi:MAG TPA: SOS response-associated peptidase family protein [Sediminibacterium sp.]|nr:SOS response-associated peptidase family protein [Sediminibacterium sp.]